MSTPSVAGGIRPEPMRTTTPAGVVVRTYIGGQIDTLNQAIARMQRYEPGSVGLTRTIIHRIRTVIRGYRRLFADPPYGGPQLDRLLTDLKHAEDLEALRVHFADRFDQLALTVAEYPRWHRTLRAEQDAAYRQIDRISTQTWVAALLGHVRVFADRAELTPDGREPVTSLGETLTRAKHRLLDTYAKLHYAADLSAARDEIRRAARHARYMAEAVRPALTWVADDVIVPVAGLERLLRQHRQATIAENWLQRLPGADRADRLTATLLQLERQQLQQLGEEIDQIAAAMIGLWR